MKRPRTLPASYITYLVEETSPTHLLQRKNISCNEYTVDDIYHVSLTGLYAVNLFLQNANTDVTGTAPQCKDTRPPTGSSGAAECEYFGMFGSIPSRYGDVASDRPIRFIKPSPTRHLCAMPFFAILYTQPRF